MLRVVPALLWRNYRVEEDGRRYHLQPAEGWMRVVDEADREVGRARYDAWRDIGTIAGPGGPIVIRFRSFRPTRFEADGRTYRLEWSATGRLRVSWNGTVFAQGRAAFDGGVRVDRWHPDAEPFVRELALLLSLRMASFVIGWGVAAAV